MTMAQNIKHLLVIEIECLDKQSHTEARDRLVRWLETYGYTSPGHGFEFSSVDVMTRKRSSASSIDGSPLRDLARRLREVAREHIAYSQVAEFMNHVDNHLSAVAYAEEVNRERINKETT